MMFAITMLLMAAAPATHPVHVRHPVRTVRVVRVGRPARKARRPITMSLKRFQPDDCGPSPICVTGTPESRYRLSLATAVEPSEKDMALAEDGTRCALIGQTICPRRTRKIMQLGDPAPGTSASALIR